MAKSSSVTLECVALSWVAARRVALCALTTLTISALALSTYGVRAAAAEESGSLTFVTAQPLTLTWARLLHGRSIEVCNGGAASVPRFQVIPADFAFTRDGAAVAPSRVLTVISPKRPVRAGACAPISVTLTSEAPIDPGEYDGSLLLVAAGHGGSVRLPTTVMTASKKAAAPAGVAEPTTLSIRNASPWSHNATATLLVKGPGPTEEALAIGKDCNAAAPNEADCPALGNLYQDSNVVRVSVDGPSRFNGDKGVQEVPVELHAFQHPVGAYEGALALPGSTQTIKLKLNAKDAWWWAAIALFIGVLVALVTQLWNGRWQPRGALVERSEHIASRYGAKTVPGHDGVEMDCNKLETYAAAVKAAIAQYAASVVMLDPTSDAYKAIDTSLKLAEDDAAVFTGPGGLGPVLDQLQREAEETTRMLGFVQVTDVPEILKAASELLGGEKLGVGGATKRVEAAGQLLPVLISWRELANDFMAHVVWMKALSDTYDRYALTYTGARMSGLRQRLFEVKNASELGTLRSSEKLSTTFDRIAYLGAMSQIPQPAPKSLPLDIHRNVDLEKVGKLELEAIGYRSVEGDALTFATALAQPAGVVIEPAKAAKLPDPRLGRRVGDWIALATTLIVSVVAGLSTFYFTKSFGAPSDYLTVIVVGSAAQTLLKAVLNQTSILLHDFPPATPAVPARIVAPPAAVGRS